MISSGGAGGGLPLPQTATEWLALAAAVLFLVWVIRNWLDRG